MAQDYDLFSGKVGGGQAQQPMNTENVLAMLLKLQKGQEGQMPPPSAAPVGQPAPTGTRGGAPMPSMQKPPLAQALGKGSVTSPMSGRGMPTPRLQYGSGAGAGGGGAGAAGAGGGTMAGGQMGGGGGQGSVGGTGSMAGGKGVGVGATGAPEAPPEEGGSKYSGIGKLGGMIGQIGEAGMEIYDALSTDDQEKLIREQREQLELQNEHRRKFMDTYDKYFLPMQVGTQLYSYQKMSQNSDQYELTSQYLKDFLQGSKGVWGGQSQWNNVWDTIGDPETGPPDDFMGELQYNYENNIVDPGQIAVTNWMISQLLPNMPEGITSWISMELCKWGNAFMQSIVG